MAGRPRFAPTPEQRNMVKNLAAAGVDQIRIAAAVGIDKKTLAKRFRVELDISKTQVTAIAQSKLFAAIQSGEAWAVCFWLKCRERWQEVQRIQHTGADDAPIEVNVSGIDLLESRISRIAERRRESGGIQRVNGHADPQPPV